MWKHFFFFPIICVLLSSSSEASNSSSCPIDFSYVNTFRWDSTKCNAGGATAACCYPLRALFRVGLSTHLRKTQTFFFPDLHTSASCLSDFHSHLSSIPNKTFSACFTSPNEFLTNTSNCDGIITVSDLVTKLGPSTWLDSYCRGDNADPGNCAKCTTAYSSVAARLQSGKQNSTKCVEFIILYTAGIISCLGPLAYGTALCLQGVPLAAPESKSNSKSAKNTIIAISGAVMGTLIVLAVILIYKKRFNKRRETQLHTDYVRNVKARVLPNNGAKWFQIAELVAATNRFSQQNFIGRGGFGAVYRGTLADGTVVAVKKMTTFDTEEEADDDFVN